MRGLLSYMTAIGLKPTQFLTEWAFKAVGHSDSTCTLGP